MGSGSVPDNIRANQALALNGNAAVSRVLGSAANSPIAQQRTQETGNLTIGSMF